MHPIRKNRVLFCRSNPVHPDPRVEKEARALYQAGFEVNLLGWDRTGELPIFEEQIEYNIHRLPIRAKYGTGIANLPALLRWQIQLIYWLFYHRQEYDIIHACDFDTVLPALIARSLAGKKVIYDIFDFYADHLRQTPTWIKATIRHMDYFAVRSADVVVLCDEARLQQIDGASPRKLIYIYNAPEDVGITSSVSSSKGRLRIGYVGLIQKERMLWEVLEVIQDQPEWSLDLAGFGGDEELIASKARQMPNVNWYGRIPYPKAIDLNRAADVLIALYDPLIPNHRFASPNKVFEAMMLSKPLVVAAGTNVDQLVQDSQCGLVIPYGDKQALHEAFTWLANNPDRRTDMGKNGRKLYEKQFSWGIMQNRLIDLYQDLADETAIRR